MNQNQKNTNGNTPADPLNKEKDFNRLAYLLDTQYGDDPTAKQLLQVQIAVEFHKDKRQEILARELSSVATGMKELIDRQDGLTKELSSVATGMRDLIDTVKTEGKASGELGRKMLRESRTLSWVTALLFVGTLWMAVSTSDLAKQGQDSHDRERAELSVDHQKVDKERADINTQRQKLEQQRIKQDAWEKAHVKPAQAPPPKHHQ